ncbi:MULTISPECIES: protein usd [Bacillus]|nr:MULTISPECIES: protein usd [Bacillus]POO82474.1 protein usd [Bacillus sp. MBGLi97]AUS11765.1 protein usd [Bacillus subtilis]AUZ40745.1 protein usd [Bacillus sp. MBGLi79]MCM2581192.1 protein usd [Bacillus stercoris]MDK2599865.1 protein usd [Bacillus stercoris]
MGIFHKLTFKTIQQRSGIMNDSLQNTDLISHFSHPF